MIIKSDYEPGAIFVIEVQDENRYTGLGDIEIFLCPCGHFCELPVRVSRAQTFECCECARMSHHDCRVCQKPAKAV